MWRVIVLLNVLALLFQATGCAGSSRPGDAEGPKRPVADAGERFRAPDAAIGTRWHWVGTVTPAGRIAIDDPQHYTLLLREDGRAEMLFDCNRGGGSYRIDEGELSFGPLMSTRMACAPGSQDTVYMAQLEQIRAFFLEGGELFLEMAAEGGTMHFERADESD